RTAAQRRGGSAEAALVSALAVCAGLLHWLRGEDDARRPGSDRTEGIRGSGDRNRARREGAGARGCAPRFDQFVGLTLRRVQRTRPTVADLVCCDRVGRTLLGPAIQKLRALEPGGIR